MQPSPPQSPLSHFKLLESRDLFETRELVAGVFNDHQLRQTGRHQALDYRHHHLTVGALGFSVIGYGADVLIKTSELESFYLLQMPLRGEDRQVNRQGQVRSKVGGATVHTPQDALTMNWSADCRKLAIRIDRQTVERYSSHLSQRRDRSPLRLPTEIDTSRGSGLALKLTAGQIFKGLCEQPGLFRLPMFWSQFEQMFLTSLLALQPDAAEAGSGSPAGVVMPKGVKLAEEYIRAHLAEPITLEALATIAGTSIRSLHDSFSKYLGSSPMRYIRTLRLAQVRSELLDPRSDRTVTEVAQHWGFPELGRFAQMYRETYGELPSDSRRRAR